MNVWRVLQTALRKAFGILLKVPCVAGARRYLANTTQDTDVVTLGFSSSDGSTYLLLYLTGDKPYSRSRACLVVDSKRQRALACLKPDTAADLWLLRYGYEERLAHNMLDDDVDLALLVVLNNAERVTLRYDASVCEPMVRLRG